MTLSEDFKEKLYRHLRGQDTLTERIEFRKLLRDNKDLERIYYELKDAHFTYTPENYHAFLLERVAETEAKQAVNAEVKDVSSEPSWLTRLIGNVKNTFGNIALPGSSSYSPWPGYARLAFVVVVLLGVGWGFGIWRQKGYQNNMLGNYGNAYGPSAGASDADSCGNDIKDKYYILATDQETARKNISQLDKELITDACKAYYEGRSYLSLMDYENAIRSFMTARKTDDPKMREMAEFDLALSYILIGEKEKGLQILNSRRDWKSPKVIDHLKAAVR